MRQFFEPAEAPLWLKRVLFSIRDGLSDVWATALRLKDYATASLPPAADWKQGLVYDSTLNAVKVSDGTNWLQFVDLTAADARYVNVAGDTMTGALTFSSTAYVKGNATNGIRFNNGADTLNLFTIADNGAITAHQNQTFTVTGALAGAAATFSGLLTASAGVTVTGTVTTTTINHATGTNLQIGGTTIAALSATGLSVTGEVSASGQVNGERARFSGGGVVRIENTGSGTVTGWTGVGLDFFAAGGISYFQSYNYTTSAWAPFTLRASSIVFDISGTTIATVSSTGFAVTGDITAWGVFKVGANQVLGARKTGWAAATGTATRTTFDTTTVTTAQLAERVKALIDDLITHGLIGT